MASLAKSWCTQVQMWVSFNYTIQNSVCSFKILIIQHRGMGSSPANQFFKSTYIKILNQARQTVGGKKIFKWVQGLLKRIISEIGSWTSSALKLQSEKQTVFIGKMENLHKVHNVPGSLAWITISLWPGCSTHLQVSWLSCKQKCCQFCDSSLHPLSVFIAYGKDWIKEKKSQATW